MKLRIQESKIVLRLQQNEILLLIEIRKITQLINVPGGAIVITLEVTNKLEIDLRYSDNTYSFSFPEDRLEEWSGSNKVGYVKSFGDTTLSIEKDLPRRNESPNDNA